MKTTIKTLPVWIIIVSVLFALMELAVSFLICFSPESVLEKADLSNKSIQFLIYIWASRQLALGVILAFATLRKSASMLVLCYLFLLVMFTGDLFIGLAQKENNMVMSALVMCIISIVMLYSTSKKEIHITK